MKKIGLFLPPLFLLCANYHSSQAQSTNQNNRFTNELEALQGYFNIPGLAALVKKGNTVIYENYFGFADIEKKLPVNSATAFPVASLTKIFAGVLIMQLVEEGKLSLDDAVNKFAPGIDIPDDIKVKHLLSHTSQGQPGKQFCYSSRFSLLSVIIQQAGGQSFEHLLYSKLFKPAGLHHTFLYKDSLKNTQNTIAKPYGFNGKITEGSADYGFSAAAGIVSTARDLAAFDNAINSNLLISKERKERMFTPFVPNSPYGYGIFTQQLLQTKLIWGYGQYDYYSSLFLKIPEHDLTLILLANNNFMSDPPRLIYGDLTYSLFALSFLKNFVLHLPTLPVLEDDNSLPATINIAKKATDENTKLFIRQKLLAQAIAASFMARFNNAEIEKSRQLVAAAYKTFPGLNNYTSITLLHNLNILKVGGNVNDFDTQIESLGKALLAQDATHPYANVYMGEYYQAKGDTNKALYHFKTIADNENFEFNWYTGAALNFIRTYYKDMGLPVPENYSEKK